MKIIKLSAIASTNDRLLEQIHQENGTAPQLVYTLDQTAGRGQQGSSWYGKAGESLAMSLFWPFPEGLEDRLPALNWLVSLVVMEGLSEGLEVPVRLKWPNDIMAGDRKLAGVLIEPQLRGAALRSTVIGLGINVNNRQFPDGLRAVSLQQLDGQERDLDTLCLDLAARLCAKLETFPTASVNALRAAYLEAQFGLGNWMEFEVQGQRFEARIADIGPAGELELLRRDQSRSAYYPKEISYCF